jgi:hypothetical protein
MATRTGKRNMNWRNDEAATLYYVEALEGNPEVDFRDDVFQWKAPLKTPALILKKTNNVLVALFGK